MPRYTEIVWLSEKRTFAVLVSRGAFYSLVKYTRGGLDYEEQVLNEDYEFWEDYTNDYEQE